MEWITELGCILADCVAKGGDCEDYFCNNVQYLKEIRGSTLVNSTGIAYVLIAYIFEDILLPLKLQHPRGCETKWSLSNPDQFLKPLRSVLSAALYVLAFLDIESLSGMRSVSMILWTGDCMVLPIQRYLRGQRMDARRMTFLPDGTVRGLLPGDDDQQHPPFLTRKWIVRRKRTRRS
jgi:hypothetical protein